MFRWAVLTGFFYSFPPPHILYPFSIPPTLPSRLTTIRAENAVSPDKNSRTNYDTGRKRG